MASSKANLNPRSSLSRLFGVAKSGVAKRTLIYSASGALNAVATFALLPVLTHYLTPSEYGAVETFLAVSAVLTGCLLVGGNSLLAREYFRFSDGERQAVVSDMLGNVLLATPIVLFLVIVADTISPGLAGYVPLSMNMLLLAVFVAAAGAIATIATTWLQVERRPLYYAAFANGRTAVDLFVSILTVAVLGFALNGRIIGITAGAVASMIGALTFFYARGAGLKMPRAYGRTLLIAGLPLVLAHITGWVTEVADRLMINRILGVADTGIYSIGYRFGMLTTLIETPFSMAWLPFFYSRLGKPSEDVRIVRATVVYLVGLLLMSIAFGLIGGRLVPLVVDVRFHAAAAIVPVVSIGYAFAGAWKVFAGYLIFNGKTGSYTAIIVVSAGLNVLLNVLLLPRLGPVGAAWATLATFVFGFLATAAVAAVVHPMPWLYSFRKESQDGRGTP